MSKSGVKGERLTKAKLKTAMKTDLDGMVQTTKISDLQNFFGYKFMKIEDLLPNRNAIIDKIVDDHFDNIIRDVQ